MEPKSIANEFLKLAQQRLHLVKAAKDLALVQADTLQRDAVEDLLVILAKKSDVLDGLSKTNKMLKSLKEDAGNDIRWPSEAARHDCQKILDDGDKILRELIAMDQIALEQMGQQRDLVSLQLQRFTAARDVQQAYGSQDSYEELTSTNSDDIEGEFNNSLDSLSLQG